MARNHVAVFARPKAWRSNSIQWLPARECNESAWKCAARVVSPALLDDCMLDVAVLGDKVAPKIYTFKIASRVVLARPTL